jgi:CRISPR/Cas system CSM-associated protein Csm4 (group 5 of RAMP superfamily)
MDDNKLIVSCEPDLQEKRTKKMNYIFESTYEEVQAAYKQSKYFLNAPSK